MNRNRWIVVFVLGLAFGASLLAVVPAQGAAAQETTGAESDEVTLTPSRDSGVSGRAVLEEVEDGVRVDLAVRGLPEEGVEHINHFRGGGICADDRAGRTAPVTIPLNPVVAREDGTGSATTVVEDVTLDELFAEDEERFLLLHDKAEGGGVSPRITCADLTRTGTASVDVLPESGGPQALALVAFAGLLAGLGVLASVVTSRR